MYFPNSGGQAFSEGIIWSPAKMFRRHPGEKTKYVFLIGKLQSFIMTSIIYKSECSKLKELNTYYIIHYLPKIAIFLKFSLLFAGVKNALNSKDLCTLSR